MREAFYKFVPWVFGAFLGWFLLNPPEWLESLGPLAYGVNLALCFLMLLSFVALIIIANLPGQARMEPVTDDAVHRSLLELRERIVRLGFRPAGPARRVHVAPSGILLAFVHGSEPVYATTFRTGTLDAKTAFDFVSILHGDSGWLTTNAEPCSAALPAGPGGLRQVFLGESVETLYSKHVEGMRYLRDRGVHCRPVSADMFERDFVAAISSQRSFFLSSPLRSTLLTLWRAVTKKVPYVGPLSGQKVAQQQISRLLAAG